MLWLFKINFRGFRRFLIHGNSSYAVLYTQCLGYRIAGFVTRTLMSRLTESATLKSVTFLSRDFLSCEIL